jgi:hypothetical protein
MKATINYTLENGAGLEMKIEPTGKKEPEFKVEVTIKNPEHFEESKSDTLDMIMSAGMKHVIEMKTWPEMYEVVTTNFEIGQTPMGDDPNAEMGLGLLFGGPRNEA